jgi:hypothetical protein
MISTLKEENIQLRALLAAHNISAPPSQVLEEDEYDDTDEMMALPAVHPNDEIYIEK